MKKFIGILLAVSICMSIVCIPTMATDINEEPVHEVMVVDEIETRASSAPSELKNLGGDNSYSGSLIDLAATKGSYTKYYFATGTGNIYVKLDLERSGTTANKTRKLNVVLYEKSKATAFGTEKDTKKVSFTEAEATKRVVFTGLDSDKFYYIYFYNDSSSSAGDSLDISGTILVDDSYN